MLLGSTGSGKTLLAQTWHGFSTYHFAIADATSLTEAGYVGEDVENILLKLIQAADYDVERAERGSFTLMKSIKLLVNQKIRQLHEMFLRRGASFIKDFRGNHCCVPPQGGRKHPHQEFIQIDTTNILFICGWCF